MQESKLHSYLLLHFVIFIWGFTAILGALISIDAIPLVWYRMLLGAIFILIYFLVQKKSFKIDKKGIIKFLLTEVLLPFIGLHFLKP